MRISRICALVGMAAIVAACTTTPPEKPVKPGEMKLTFKQIEYAQLPPMPEENWQPALVAFKESCKKMMTKPGWEDVCAKAQNIPLAQARTFFAAYFTPYQAIAETVDQNGAVTLSDSGKMTKPIRAK